MATSIVGARSAGGNITGLDTSVTATVAAPTGTTDGDLIVITATLVTTAADAGVPITGSISSSDYSSVASYGIESFYESPTGYPWCWYSRSWAGIYATGDAPFAITWTIDSPVYFTGSGGAGGRVTITAIRGVSSWAASSRTYDRSSSTWALGSGTSPGGVFGTISRPEWTNALNLASAGTTTTVTVAPFCRFWDVDAGPWTLPTVQTSAVPTYVPGRAVWLSLNPPAGGGIFHGHPIGAGFSGIVAVG